MVTRRNFLKTVAAGAVVLESDLMARGGRESLQPFTRARSAASGRWSTPGTWEGRAIPAPGSVVQILPGHRVLYDINAEHPIRMVHVLGTLSFARDRDTR